MTAQTPTKVTVMAGSDQWKLVEHIRGTFLTARTVIPVADRAERDGLAALFPNNTLPIGTTVFLTDIARLQVWDGNKWGGPAYGQLAATTNASANVVGIALNNMLETSPYVEKGRIIEVKALVDASSTDIDALYVGFTLMQGGTGTGGNPLRTVPKRYATKGLGEGLEFSARYTPTAAGPLRFALIGQVTVPATGAQVLTAPTGNSKLTVTDIGPA